MKSRHANCALPTLTLAIAISWLGAASGAESAAGATAQARAMPDPVDWQTLPVDLSFLNAAERPAGRRGFISARGETLRFADGTVARLWGTNLTAAALFGTDRNAVKRQARRLSQLGFNLVRLHHHDSYWVQPNIFGTGANVLAGEPHADMLDRIDWWIHCLKEEGIYVWLDLHVQRHLKRGDGVAGFDEIAKGAEGVELKGFNYVNDDIRGAMKRFNEAYLGHVNTYTRLAYKDDPAIAAVLVTNENDVTHHFANALLPDKNVPFHTKLYLERARAFARRHGLSEDRSWQSWRAGPASLFLNDLEYRFHADMVDHLRSIGVKVPIIATNLWGGLLVSLPALTAGDMIDVHAYERTGFLERDPRYGWNAVHTMAAAQLPGRPLSVTEWNMSTFPAPDRHALALYVGATASHQGWDAMMQYAYAQTPLQVAGVPSNWHAFNDPSMLAALPAAALLYRRADVREAATVRVFAPSRADVFDRLVGASSWAGVRAAAETGRLTTVLPAVAELPWLATGDMPRESAAFLKDPTRGLLPEGADAIVSDTGELKRDWRRGLFTIDAVRTQAVAGRMDGEPISLKNIRLVLDGPASVAVQSLDDAPIALSADILISIATPSAPVAPHLLPFRSEALAGTIAIEGRPGLHLQMAATAGGELQRMPRVVYRNGVYTIHLDGRSPVHWLRLGLNGHARKFE